MTRKRLNNRQQAFCVEYLIDLKPAAAAIRAGYKEKWARKQASKMLQEPQIAELIERENDKRLERIRVDSDYVLRRHVDIDQMDVIHIFNEDMSIKPISEWPPIWRQFLSGLDVTEHIVRATADEEDDQSVLASLVKKIKWPDKLKNLELLGKHVKVQAYRDTVQVGIQTIPEFLEGLKDD